MRAVFAGLVVGLGLMGAPALAEDPSPAAGASAAFYGDLQQAPITEDQIEHYLDAMADMQDAMGDAPADAAQPDAKTMAKLEAAAKKHGFKNFDDYNAVAGNISLVLDGIDPDTKTYVGADKMIQKSIAQVKGDKEMTAKDKQAALADLNAQLKAATPVKYKENIDLVVKHYDKLAAG